MHECCKLLQIIFCNAFLLITSVLMDMDVHTHTQSSSGGSGTPFLAALSSFSLGESTTASNFSNQSTQRERKGLIQKVAESVVSFCKYESIDHDAKKEKTQMGFKKKSKPKQNPEESTFPFTGKKYQ